MEENTGEQWFMKSGTIYKEQNAFTSEAINEVESTRCAVPKIELSLDGDYLETCPGHVLYSVIRNPNTCATEQD